MSTQNGSMQEARPWQRLLLSRLGKEKDAKTVYDLAKGSFLGFAAYLFSSVPLLFSVNPLALCLLCAVEQKSILWVLGGILLGLWQSGGSYWLVISALCCVPWRMIARLFFTTQHATDKPSPHGLRRQLCTWFHQRLSRLTQPGHEISPSERVALPILFDEPIHLRAVVALLCALIPCLAIPIQGGFSYYDLYGAVFTLALTPALCTLLSLAVAESGTTPSNRHTRLWQILGVAVLLGGFGLCGRSVMLLGISPVVVLTLIFSLVSLHRRGVLCGLGIGLWCGLCYDPLTVPMFLLFTLIYALLKDVVDRFCCIPAALGGLIYLLLCGDETAVWRLAPSLLSGCILFLGGLRVYRRLIEMRSQADPIQGEMWQLKEALVSEELRHRRMVRQLSTISGAFSHLSEIFRQYESKSPSPSSAELRRLCEGCIDDHCRACPHEERCVEMHSTALVETLHHLIQALQENGKATEGQFEKSLRGFCTSKQEILADINHALTRLNLQKIQEAGSEPFAHECDEISHLLRDTVRQDHYETGKDTHKQMLPGILAYLRNNSIPTRQVLIHGRERLELRFLGLTPASLPLPPDQFRQDIAAIVKAPVSQLLSDNDEEGTLMLHTLPLLRADYVHRSLATMQSPDVTIPRATCGDTLRVFVSEQGIFYALLCDGMGKGRRAAQASSMCGIFLERLLKAGVEIKTALRMFNHYLLTHNHAPEEEISTTVDLFALNLYTGQACFVKSGAAPSLILREGRLFRLCAHTLPIGILHAVDVQIIPFEVSAGDHILLISDGICDAEEGEQEADWLSDYLSGDYPEDDNALIGSLFSKARAHGSDDDMSVISIRIFSET